MSIENKQNLPNFAETLKNRWRGLIKERLPVVEQDVVRVLALQIQAPEKIVCCLIPDANTLTSKKEFDHTCFDELGFSISTWLHKGNQAKNPHQLMLLGGKINPNETPLQAGTRNLQTEGHVFGVDATNLGSYFQRIYSFHLFENGKKIKRNNHEYTFEAEIPPIEIPTSYDPSDKAEGVRLLTPHQVEQLINNEQIEIPPDSSGKPRQAKLLDSLCIKPENIPHHVTTAENETLLARMEIERRVKIFDVQVEIEVINKFIKLFDTDDKTKQNFRKKWDFLKENEFLFVNAISNNDIRNIRMNIKRFLMDFEKQLFAQDVDLSKTLTQEQLIAYKQAGIEEVRLRKRIKLSENLKIAAQLVYFEHNLPFIEKSGPQKAFLLAQLLLKLDQFDEKVTAAIDACPEIKMVYDAACAPFGIHRSQFGWEKELKLKLEEYRNIGYKTLINQATVEEKVDYENRKIALETSFCQSLGINPSMIAQLGYSADGFEEYIGRAISQIADPVLRAQLTSSRFQQWNSLDEVILGYFGIGYPNETAFDFPVRYSAIRKLLLMVNYQFERRLWNEHIQKDNVLFDALFEMNFEAEEDKLLDLNHNTVLHGFRYRESVKLNIQLPDGQQIEIIQRPAIYTKTRIKNPLSGLRKRLERGAENDEISDNNGRMYVLDEGDFWKAFVRKYPEYIKFKKVICEQWSKAIIFHLINFYSTSADNSGYKYEVSKVRNSGFLTDIVSEPIHARHSQASNGLFTWCKFVHTAKSPGITYQEEVQMFPSIEDAQVKINDDPRYDLERLFMPYMSKDESTHEIQENRFPLMLVLYGVKGLIYETVIRQKNQNKLNK